MTGMMYTHEAESIGGPAIGWFATERARGMLVPEAMLRSLVALADRAWREPRRQHPTRADDYREALAMYDGREAFFTEGRGPLRGAAGEVVARLREFADRNRPDR
jgi:hypothetical protein